MQKRNISKLRDTVTNTNKQVMAYAHNLYLSLARLLNYFCYSKVQKKNRESQIIILCKFIDTNISQKCEQIEVIFF